MTQERIDSTKVGNGRFRLKGRVESPERYLLEVNANPAGTPAQDLDVEQIFLTAFYLGNSKITVSADTETMQTLYWQQDREVQPTLVEGSVQEDLHRQLGGGGRRVVPETKGAGSFCCRPFPYFRRVTPGFHPPGINAR